MNARLRRARYDAGLSVKDLADRADVHPDTITGAENGATPQAPTAKRIADALDLKPSDLFITDDVPEAA